MSTELILPGSLNTLMAEREKDAQNSSVGGYPPRVNLLALTSKAVAQKKGTMQDWLFTRSATSWKNLGVTFEAVVVTSRAKAAYFKPTGGIDLSFNTKDALYREIMLKADAPATKQSAIHGPEYLLWIPPTEDGAGGLTTYHCSSWSARNAAELLHTFKGKAVKFGSLVLSNKKGQSYPGATFELAESLTVDEFNAWAAANAEVAERIISEFVTPRIEEEVAALAEEVGNR